MEEAATRSTRWSGSGGSRYPINKGESLHALRARLFFGEEARRHHLDEQTNHDPRRCARWSTSSPHAKLHGMGWQYEEHAAHEGCVIGYVARDGCAPEAGLYRELVYPRDDGDRRVACIAAGCDCGWRSPRWVPRRPATWAPFSVLASEADEDRARALWRRHLELDVIAAHPLRVDATATRAELARRGERASADLAAADVIDLAGYQRGDR